MNYNVPQAFLFPFPFDRKMVSGDIKSHFELTLAISKKLAEMQKNANWRVLLRNSDKNLIAVIIDKR